MQITQRLKSVIYFKSLWLAFLINNLVEQHSILAQDPDIVSSCTRYKKSVYDLQQAYSFLLPDAEIITKTVDTCRSYTPLIVGGIPAEPKEFPLMARLGRRNDNENVTKWFCGGTLISNRVVLTAAHCLYSDLGEINMVRLGELDFDSDKDDAQPEDFGVHNTTEHPDFKFPELYNDIALVELDRGVRFNVYKHPACLPFNDSSQLKSFIAAGWGLTSYAGHSSNKLLKVKLTEAFDDCNKTAEDIEDLPNGYNASTQLCIGSKDNKDTCSGDSGGPVLTYHEEYPCMYHVVGITSVGIGCANLNHPSFYTRVHFYLDWIKQEMKRIS